MGTIARPFEPHRRQASQIAGSMSTRLRKQIALGIGSLIAAGGTYSVVSSSVAKAKEGSKDEQRKRDLQAYVPSRKEIMAKLKSNYTYDMLVIGGGATGSGIALVRPLPFYLNCFNHCTSKIHYVHNG
jgi:hypothetical protein